MNERSGNVAEDGVNEFEMIPDRFSVLPHVTQG